MFVQTKTTFYAKFLPNQQTDLTLSRQSEGVVGAGHHPHHLLIVQTLDAERLQPANTNQRFQAASTKASQRMQTTPYWSEQSPCPSWPCSPDPQLQTSVCREGSTSLASGTAPTTGVRATARTLERPALLSSRGDTARRKSSLRWTPNSSRNIFECMRSRKTGFKRQTGDMCKKNAVNG